MNEQGVSLLRRVLAEGLGTAILVLSLIHI